MVVGHVGNSCLFFEKMLAEEGEEDTVYWQLRIQTFPFIQIQVYMKDLFEWKIIFEFSKSYFELLLIILEEGRTVDTFDS